MIHDTLKLDCGVEPASTKDQAETLTTASPRAPTTPSPPRRTWSILEIA